MELVHTENGRPSRARSFASTRPRTRSSRLTRLALTLTWTLFVVALFFAGVEGVLARYEMGLPHMHWFWDASDLHPTPIFVPGAEPGVLSTDPLFLRADNPPQSFRRRKEPGAFRIFCVGSSTTAGWPFHRRAGYPAWLGELARDAVPDEKVEVINAGIHGFDTVRTIAVADEVLDLDPDLIVLYTGYNDYGGYSYRHRGGALRRIVRRLHAALVLRSRLYNVLLGLSARVPETAVTRSGIVLSPEEETQLLSEYAGSMRDFLERARARGVAVALVTLPFSDRYLHGSSLPAIWQRMNATLHEIAADEAAPLVDAAPLALVPGSFVDSVHASIAGYRWIAHRAIETLCDAGSFPVPCALDRLRSDAEYGAALGIDDPRFVAQTQLAVAEFYAGMHDLPALHDALRAAERSAPSPGFVFDSVQHIRSDELLRVLEEVDRELGLPERAEGIQRLRASLASRVL